MVTPYFFFMSAREYSSPFAITTSTKANSDFEFSSFGLILAATKRAAAGRDFMSGLFLNTAGSKAIVQTRPSREKKPT